MSDNEAMRKMAKLITYLISRQDSVPFREPVDWKGLELFDYPKIVKKPMDLGTVKRKMERGLYETIEECAADIRLIWTNCKTYNADGSDFYLLAESFSKRFEERYKKIDMELDANNNQDDSLVSPLKQNSSLDVKAKFAANIFRLSGMELGHVLQVLDLKCPNALEDPESSADSNTRTSLNSQVDEAQVEINVDAIDPRTFAELDRYVKDKIFARTTGEDIEEYEIIAKRSKR